MKTNFEETKMLELLKDFYNLAKLRIVIFDTEFNKITAYPQDSCSFCSRLKQSDILRDKCSQSDRNACLICREKKSLHIYKCHAGLIEVVAPINYNGVVIGYIMLGQFMEKNEKKASKPAVMEYCRKYLDDSGMPENYYDRLSVKTEGQIKSASKILETCACYLWMTQQIKIDGENIVYHLTNYISNHIRENLSVERLCNEFSVSRSRLYEISNTYYAMSIAAYIRKKKIDIAKSFLETGEYSVAEAADAAGFYDYNYFSKVFRRETGISPLRYKKSFKI